MKLLKNISFRRKIFVGMLMAAGIPMVIGYFVMLQMFNLTYENNLNQEAETILNVVAGSFDSAFSNIYDAMWQLGSAEVIKESLQTGEQSETAVYRELYAVSSKYSKYAYFTIYNAEGYKISSVAENTYIKDKLPLDWSVLYEASQKPGEMVVRNARLYEGQERVEFLRIAMAVCSDEEEIIGYIVATLNKGMFDNLLNDLVKEEQGTIYAIDSFHELVYSSADSYDEEELRAARQSLLRKENAGEVQSTCQSLDREYFFHARYEKNSCLYILYQQPIAALDNMKNAAMTIAVLSGLAGLGICILLSGYTSNFIYRPIKRMQEAFSEIRKGNFKAKIQVESQDELGQLSESFNVMAEHLSGNMDCLLTRERELSEARIQMMQAQLNPHFLYNALDTIKWLGKANEVPEIATISAGLAKILRMSISAKSEITLAKEVELAEAYVQIQEIRFADRFEFIVDVPDELSDCLVPKQILQPIIENAIIHGLEDRENGRVMVQAKLLDEDEEKVLQILIRDDGVGMSPEQVEKLNHCEKNGAPVKEQKSGSESRHSIGYYNVNEIIRLNYGESYGLHAESESGVGSTIYMTLPVRKGVRNV